jgi:hypothetical protein
MLVDLHESSALVYLSWAIPQSWVWASLSRKDGGGGCGCSAEMIGSSWGASICICVCRVVSYLIHPFHLPAHWNINEPSPGLSRLQQRPSQSQSARSGTRAARSGEEESGGEDGAFTLGIREEAQRSGAG